MTALFKALADENRLRVLNLIVNGHWCGCEIEVLLEMTQSNVSRHLTKLKATGIIKGDKSAQWVHYSLSEHFALKNKDLYAYMLKQFQYYSVYQNDIKRAETYKRSGMTCGWITTDKAKVLELLACNIAPDVNKVNT